MRSTLATTALMGLALLAPHPTSAGLLDDIRGVVDDVSGAIDDTKETKQDVEDAVGDGKDLVPERPETEWHVAIGGKQRKLSEAQLQQEIESGSLARDALVWRKGQGEWQPAGSVEGLRGYFEAAPPPLPDANDGPPPLPPGGAG